MEIVHLTPPAKGRGQASPLIERLAPGSGRRIAALRRPRRGPIRAPRTLGPESARRVEAMLRLLPPDKVPRGAIEEQAARDLEPVHAGLASLLGPGRHPFRSLGPSWRAYRDAACAAAGLEPPALRFLPGRMAAASDLLARSIASMPDPALRSEGAWPWLRTGAARLLWGHCGLVEAIQVLRNAEELAPRGRPGLWLPARLARLDEGGWERALRREAEGFHRDPGPWGLAEA